jgi:PKD repeat protein
MQLSRPILALLCCFISFSTGFTQSAPDLNCGFDGTRSPAFAQRLLRFEEQLSRYFSNKKSPDAATQGLPHVVPVVVHIIHNGGPENISDAQVQAAVEHLNLGFAAQGYFAQQGATVHTQIQFCLAKRDPDGKATTGITRTQSPLTSMVLEYQDIALKDLSRWNPLEYVNIWVIQEIYSEGIGPGVVGYAVFPDAHGEPTDGMVCEARYFGTSPAEDAVLIHEMGHFLGLYHTFQGGCSNDDCTQEGDRVCDTPPDKATHTTCPYNSCPTDVAPGSPFISDVDDLTSNFMDYSPFPCYHAFTAGQAVRIQGTLETVRSSLLNSKGCLDPCANPVVAGFSPSANPAEVGQTVTTTNTTTGATTYTWELDGFFYSDLTNPTFTFTDTGTFAVTLIATNGDPNCTDKTTRYITVKCPVIADFTASQTQIDPGQTILFTNTSSGGATDFEWSINGFPLDTTLNFSFLFQNPGYFTVTLRASGAFCSVTRETIIFVKPPCSGLTNARVELKIPGGVLEITDMAPLPDGSAIYAGRADNLPILARIAPDGSILWQKTVHQQDYSGFWDMEPLGNGEFALLAGGALQTPFFLKINEAGDFIWARELQTGYKLGVPQGVDVLAANPDGSFGFFFLGTDGKTNLGKMNADGSVDWTLQFNGFSTHGELKRTSDGTGDFLATVLPLYFGSLPITVLRVSQTGQFLTSYRISFPSENVDRGSRIRIGTHADGGFSLFLTCHLGNSGSMEKYYVRCRADGLPIWARRFNAVGLSNLNISARQVPGDGWLVNNYKSGMAGGYLMRLNETGEVLWNRKTGANAPFAVALQNGLIRFVRYTGSSSAIELMTMPDSDSPTDCLPDSSLTETVTDIPVVMQEAPVVAILKNYPATELSLNLANMTMTATSTCQTVFPCAEICDNERDDDGDGYVDCFDPDCDCLLGDNCTAPGPPDPIAAQLDWESAASPVHVYATPKVANLDPQRGNMPEIICVTSSNSGLSNLDRIFFYQGDGSNTTTPRPLDIPQRLGSANAVTVGDLDRDNIPELIVVCADELVRVYKNYNPATANAMQLWLTSDFGTGLPYAAPALADFDADGVPEIYAGNAVFKINLAGAQLRRAVIAPFGPPGRISYNPVLASSTAADLLSVADCGGDPDCAGLELAAGYEIYSIDLDLSDGDGYQIKTQRSLSNFTAPDYWMDGLTAVADMDLDGIPDVVVTGGRNISEFGVYVWNKNGLVRFMPYFFPNGSDYEPSGSIPCIANLFDDREMGAATDLPEIVATSSGRLYAFNLNASNANPANPTWWSVSTTDVSGFSGAVCFDLDGDGTQEIIYRDQTNLRILYGGNTPFPAGVDALRNWAATPVASGTAAEYPVVADVDNDGMAEIAVTGGTALPAIFGRINIFESANLPWMPCRKLWNQYNYHVTHVNDDLSIPTDMQKHWLELPPGSGRRPLNLYLTQVSSLREPFPPGTPVPDAALTVDSVRCRADSLDLHLSICNIGSATLPAQTPLAFYRSNPTTTAASLFFPPLLLDAAIAPNNCRKITLRVPAVFDSTFFLVVNDNGSAPRPFSLIYNTLSTDQKECNFENNMASFIVQNQTPPLDLGPDILLCQNSVVELTAGPGFGRYRWQDGSTAATYTAYTPGKYWVEAFDACGFRQSDTVLIALNTAATLDLPDELRVCAGDSVHLAASGFSSYLWTPADSVRCADCAETDVLAQTPLTIYLTAADGDCVVTDSVQIVVNPKPELDLQVQDGNCGTTARIAAHVTGATPFEFLWSDASTDSLLFPAAPGTYTVSVTDANGCEVSRSVAVVLSGSLVVSASSVAPRCAGSPTGSIDVTVLSGALPLQFVWSNAAGTEDLDSVPAGVYTVLITDANGCTATLSETLSDPPALVLVLQKTDPRCAGEASGALDLTAAGGTGDPAFFWSNNSTAEDLGGLPAGIYIVSVSDANGCTASLSETLTEPPALELVLQKIDPRCAGEASGALELTATGGTGNPAFSWSNNSAAEDLGGLPAGTYTVSVSDANGCLATLSETLTDPPALVLVLQKTDPRCAGEASGALDLTATGGTGSPAFFWSTNSATEDLGGLPAGTYTVSVSDANGCSATLSETLTEPAPLILVLTDLISPPCPAIPEGSATVAASGGSGALVINWSNSVNGPTATGLAAGTYTATVTDANGCTATVSATVQALDLISPVIQAGPVTIPLGPSGSVTLTLSNLGATVGDNCALSSVAFSPATFDCSDLGAHEVTLIATDNSGNTANLTVTVTITDDSAPSLVCPPGLTRCANDNVVQYAAPVATDNCLVLGGQFDLAQGLPGGSVFPPGATTNVYTFTDAQGNTGACSFVVTVLSPLKIVLDSIIHDIGSQQIGGVLVSVSGSQPGYTYHWTANGQPVATTPDLSGVGAGTYFLSVSDSHGCTALAGPFVVDNLSATQAPGLSDQVGIFPNPTTGELFAIFTADLASEQKYVAVFDATGRRVQEQLDQSRKTISMDLSHLPEGLYSVLIRVRGKQGIWKVVVSR